VGQLEPDALRAAARRGHHGHLAVSPWRCARPPRRPPCSPRARRRPARSSRWWRRRR
jgi:hypothetical protein